MVLLDTGSSRTFITINLAQQLHRPFLRTEEVTVFIFENIRSPLRYNSQLLQFTLQNR